VRLKKHIRIHNISALSVICSIAFVSIALIIRFLTGSPYKIINYCGLRGVIPPVWVMVVMWLFWYVVLGIAFGEVVESKQTRNEASKYKGGMFFVIMMALGYAWYPLFFGSGALFLGLLICEFVFILSTVCTVYFACIDRLSSLFMAMFSFWMLWMIGLNIIALLNC